jgi:hypothetical protein
VSEQEEGGEILAQFEKNSREVVRIRRVTYNGRELVDIRSWYPAGDALKPGKGLSLRIEQLKELRKALAAAEKALATERAAG